MARARKPGGASAEAPAIVAASRPGIGPGLMWLGWTLLGLGSATGALGEGGAAAIGWVVAGLGAASIAVGLFLGRIEPRAWLLGGSGAVLLVGGAATLLHPAFFPVERARQLAADESMLPAVAVAMALAGVVLLLVHLHRSGSSEPPFSPEEEAKYERWWPRLRLVIPPIGLYYLPLYLYESWRELDREAAREREAHAGEGYDYRPLVALAVGAVCLALMEYLGHQVHTPNAVISMRELFDLMAPRDVRDPPDTLWYALRGSPFSELLGFVWWSGWRVLGFFLLPAIVVKLVFRERLVDYGLATAGFLKHAWIYVAFVLWMAVIVAVVSHEESFRLYYPFYGYASRSWFDFWAWELLYAAQFFSLEFFFRGFWLKAAKRAMGSHAIYAMVVPYCMIHFGKPFLETIAAIVAGVILGTLALRTRSIWSGFLIHVSVAIAMDMAALLQKSGLPDRFWPEL